MKNWRKFICSLFAGILTLSLSLSSSYAAELSLRDELLMKHTIHTLWDMGLVTIGKSSSETLCQNTLIFLSRGRFGSENRYEQPDRFTNIPEEYNNFIKKEEVEKTALNVFGGWIDKNNLCQYVFLGSEGYYFDLLSLLDTAQLNYELIDLPSFVEVTSKHIDNKGAVILDGKLRRFKMMDDGEIIIWSAATFMARFSPVEGGDWKLDSFVITEEAMG